MLIFLFIVTNFCKVSLVVELNKGEITNIFIKKYKSDPDDFMNYNVNAAQRITSKSWNLRKRNILAKQF